MSEILENNIIDDCYIIEEGKIYPVYNDSNFLISNDEIKDILKEGGLNEKINNLKLWQQAFIHKSMFKGSDFTKIKNILEILGQLPWLKM